MVLLPFLFFLLCNIIFATLFTADLRENILKSSLVFFVTIWISTEFLSLFDLITFRGILATWIVLVLLASGCLIWALRRGTSGPVEEKKESWTEFNASLSIISVFGLFIIIVISGITLYIALKAPPNNFDSMTYHMARIPHWIQNQNIRYYPTSIPRQNYSLPLAEFSILHLQLLSKGDHFANSIQWFSFLMAILSSSLIAKQLKLSPQGQWIAGALTATLPMAILQSTSTQNDLVVGLFCLVFAYFLGKLARKPSLDSAIFTALAMGLALGTKGTAYIYCAGIGLGIGGFALFGKNWQEIKRLSMSYGMIIIIALTLNTGIYLRNWQLYRHPLITSNERVLVDKVSIKILGANLVRNSVMNLASPIQPLNRVLERGTGWLLGYQTNNPASTFQNTQFALTFSINADDAGNGLHFVLILLAVFIVPWMKSENGKDINRYLLTLLFTFLIYSLAFKWQPWGGRLQTPLFLLGTVVPALVLDKLFSTNLLPGIILAVFFLTSIPYLVMNRIRPLLPLWEDSTVFVDPAGKRKFLTGLERAPALSRQLDSFVSIFYEGRSVVFTERRQLYFLSNFDLYDPYRLVGHYLRNTPARQIGLIMDSNDWEYPIWVLVGQEASPGLLNFAHIDVENVSKSLQNLPQNPPELLVVTRNDYQKLKILSDYEEVKKAGKIRIFQLK